MRLENRLCACGCGQVVDRRCKTKRSHHHCLPQNIQERFWSQVEKTKSCWNWQGRVRKGYGVLNVNRRVVAAHRYAYEQMKGKIPEGLVLDHICRNKRCVNPDHLEIVTGRENILRGVSPSAINARKTHCPKGHILLPTKAPDRSRRCNICWKEQRQAAFKRWYDKHKRAKLEAKAGEIGK